MLSRRAFFAVLYLTLFLFAPILVSPAQNSAQAAAQAQSAETAIGQLEALTGEYTNQVEPDTLLSFYVLNGKLYIESERLVPIELKPVSAGKFAFPDSKETLRFTLDAEGRGDTVAFYSDN